MGGVTKERRASSAVLRAVSRGRRLDRALAGETASLSQRERRWVQEVTYGTSRFRGRLDYLLDLHLRDGLGSVSPFLLDLLRMGAYQILFMDGVPSYAAVSQTVAQVRDVAGQGGSRLANGVLRSLEREGGDSARFPELEMDPLGHLSSWGSHPRWLVERWLERWDLEEVQRLLDLNNSPPVLFLRPLGTSLPEAAALLQKKGLSSREVGPGVPCLELGHGTNPAPLLEDLPWIVQDPGAALVTVYAHFPPGGLVADLCSAPGGKALAVAQAGSHVVAADRSIGRLRLVRENRERVGGRVDLFAADAQAPPLRGGQSVLLDVPCSGTGTFRRHPDARWRLTPEKVAELAGLQRRILEAGSRLVPSGGILVYSTCTLESEENEEQVEMFLSRNPEFFVEETGHVSSDYIDSRGFLSVLPQVSGFDGSFSARMVRRS